MRDLDGRTYAGASVDLPSLRLSAVEVAVAMAVASGDQGARGGGVVGRATRSTRDLAAVRELGGSGVPVLRTDARGQVAETATT